MCVFCEVKICRDILSINNVSLYYQDSLAPFVHYLSPLMVVVVVVVVVVVSMFDFHRINQGSNPGSGGKIS